MNESNATLATQKLNKTPTEMNYFLTCVLNSVSMYDLFFVADGRSDSIEKGLMKFEELKNGNAPRHDIRIYKVLSALQKKWQAARASDVETVVSLGSIVVDCAMLVSQPPGQRAQGGGTPKKYALDDCAVEFPFLFPFLQNLLNVSQTYGIPASGHWKEIYGEILKILSTLHHQLRMAPENIDCVSVQALALMLMLKQFISVRPISDIQQLEKAIDKVSSFNAWPLPFSAVVEDLLSILLAECKAPGTFLREKLMSENPKLLPSSHAASQCNANAHRVHVLIDTDSRVSAVHRVLFDALQEEFGRGRQSSLVVADLEEEEDVDQEVRLPE